MKTAVIIFNSTKKKSNFTQSLDVLIKALNERNYETIVRATLSSTDIEDYITKITHIDLLVGAGGDGTINQITNAITLNENIDPKVLFYPTGTVNDFASSLLLQNNIDYGISLLDNDKWRRIDSACINNNLYFNYVCAFGPFTSAAYSVSNNLKRDLGALAYVLKGISDVITTSTGHKMKVSTESHQFEGEYHFGMIVNSHSVGGVKSFFKAADITDGYFTLFLLNSSAKHISNLPKLIINGIGKEYMDDGVVCVNFKKATIETDEEIAWTIDGERGPIGGFNVEVIPTNVSIYTEL